ncbi:cyclic peptide export ABC transporter [Tenacibaculum halocynthiae]|uniref:cyclic peptide export ABC transporter n=1 Tax=Tenacibaculum halocynthiae TaxID=1254437 RepID=UPI0038953FFD
MENITNKLFILSGIIAFLGILYFGTVLYQIFKKERKIDFSFKKIVNYFLGFVILAPIIVSIYFFPVAFYDQNFWSSTKLENLELQTSIISIGAMIIAFYTVVRLSVFMPHKNHYFNVTPQLLLLSLFPGVASAVNVMIISKFVSEDVNAGYLLFFFIVTTFTYIVTVRISKRQTANLGILIAHKVNMTIIKKMLKSTYQKYEKIQNGKIYTMLNDDVNAIFYFSQDAVNMYIAAVTTILVVVYMFTLNIISSLMFLGATLFIFSIFFLLSKPLKKAGQKVLIKREFFNNLVSGLVNGFKELVLHKIKRDRFYTDIEKSSKSAFEARKSNVNLEIDSSLFSELSFTTAIGVTCLLFPLLFPADKDITTAYVIAVLFLWGPVGMLINTAPHIINVQVSWKRIKAFLGDDEIEEVTVNDSVGKTTIPKVGKITVKNVCFNYEGEENTLTYGIGPISFEVNESELVFIVGGNGSGKTTLLKLLVGLYEPTSGSILINDENVTNRSLSECFSVIYSDFYLFKKLYDIKEDRLNQVYEWLKVLQLSEKVKIEEGAFSTIDLSKGQRKRLAILKSYLEDRPVYFFDEVAADLDPEFRDFFYNELLVKMRAEGKILIIISHDDKYFNLADNIYKMDMGKISVLNKELTTLSSQY